MCVSECVCGCVCAIHKKGIHDLLLGACGVLCVWSVAQPWSLSRGQLHQKKTPSFEAILHAGVISMLVIQLWQILLASWLIGLIAMWLVWITNASCSTCHFHARSVHWEPLALFLHNPIHFIQAFHVRVHCIMCLSTCPPIQAFWFPRLVAMSEDDEPNV